jgi:GNAT superfamily N-acetyltransferase
VNIDRMVVEPKHQNQGIGKALLKEIESRVPNAIAYQLFTGNKSVRNINLYNKMGYQIIRNETTNQGIKLLHMAKRP